MKMVYIVLRCYIWQTECQVFLMVLLSPFFYLTVLFDLIRSLFRAIS